MTTGCLASPPIMRPCRCRTILQAYIYALLVLISKADREDSDCEDEILVRRHMFHNVTLGQHVKIECPVKFCQNSTETISWYKLEEGTHTNTSIRSISTSSHINIEVIRTGPLDATSFLVFENFVRNDSGFYQCQSKNGDLVSYKIEVMVSDDGGENKTNATPRPKSENTNPFLYIYTSGGIVAFVVLVIIISVASMLGCKRKSKKAQTNDQYIAIPMKERPLARVSHQVSPRGSPTVPPSRRSSRRKTPTSAQVNELPPPPPPPALPRDDEPCYSEIKKDRERPRKTVAEEKNSIVYAALNHQPLEGTAAAAAARPRRTIEESSEYAAIRVS